MLKAHTLLKQQMKKLFFIFLLLLILTLMGVYYFIMENTTFRTSVPHKIPIIFGRPFETDIYEDRKRTLQAACRRFELDGITFKQDRDPTKYLRLDRQNNVAFCPLFKSATSTILALFVKMSSDLFSQEEVETMMLNHDKLHVKTKKKLKYANNYTTEEGQLRYTFVFARHPFDRLVSAFEDKMIYNTSPINLKAYSKMRQHVNGSFVRFVDIVLDNKHCLRPESKCKMDSHWRPFYGSCRHCETSYDMIGKVETMWEDWRHICQQTKMAGCHEVAEEFTNKKMNSHHTSVPEKEKTLSYFKQLSAETRRELYEFYKLDFEMFGYSGQEYLYID